LPRKKRLWADCPGKRDYGQIVPEKEIMGRLPGKRYNKKRLLE
jgi:hypothetical protein